MQAAMGNEEANNLQLVETHEATVQSYPLAEELKESRRVPAEIAPSISNGLGIKDVDAPWVRLSLALLKKQREIGCQESEVVSCRTNDEHFVHIGGVELAGEFPIPVE